jgi:sugar phosphate isomerase/epimerase
VHSKNYTYVSEPQAGPQSVTWKAVPSPLRTGAVDFKLLFSVLKGQGYDGWLSLEDFSTVVPQEERVKDNIQFLKEMEAL